MGKREDKKAHKRRALETCARALFLKQGFALTSVEQIVAQADVARGTYYLYFTDKEQLFRLLIEKLLVPLALRLESCKQALSTLDSLEEARARLKGLQVDLLALLREEPEAALLYLREQRVMGPLGEWLRTLERRIEDGVTALIVDLQRRGALNAGEPRLLAKALCGQLERLLFDALLQPGSLGQLDHLAALALRTFGHGALTRTPEPFAMTPAAVAPDERTIQSHLA
jgi:AcrR family transcriptional regulator